MSGVFKKLFAPIFILIHWVQHLLGNYSGRVVSWRDKDNCFIAFRCSECGKIDKKSIVVHKLDEIEDDLNFKESD